MKTLVTWLLAHIIAFTAAHLAVAGYEGAAAPKRIGVAVDASFAMRNVWSTVPKVLEGISIKHRGAKFMVVTHPGKIGVWSLRPKLDGVRPFAPRRLDELISMPVWDEAEAVYLVTNAPTDKLEVPEEWQIVRGDGWVKP